MEPSNTLKIQSLDNDWCDKDVVILHACFQLLEDCIKEEKLLDCHIDWNCDREHQEAKNKIQNLYDWWQERKQKEGETMERKVYEEDNNKLIELIKIRSYLWT